MIFHEPKEGSGWYDTGLWDAATSPKNMWLPSQKRTSRTVAVCAKDPERMDPFAREGIRTYTDPGQMLDDGAVDVVSICTPSGLHAELAIRAAQAGKHLVVEKPMAMNLDEADRMIAACEKSGVLMTVVHPNRFRPALIELKRRMEEGAFGTIGHANATLRWNRNQAYYDQAAWRGTRAMDGGVLMNQAIHNLDLLRGSWGMWKKSPLIRRPEFAGSRRRTPPYRCSASRAGPSVLSRRRSPSIPGIWRSPWPSSVKRERR